MTDQITDYGFTFGAAEVTRMASLTDGSVCIRITGAGSQKIDVYVSPAGRSLRVFGKNGELR